MVIYCAFSEWWVKVIDFFFIVVLKVPSDGKADRRRIFDGCQQLLNTLFSGHMALLDSMVEKGLERAGAIGVGWRLIGGVGL